MIQCTGTIKHYNNIKTCTNTGHIYTINSHVNGIRHCSVIVNIINGSINSKNMVNHAKTCRNSDGRRCHSYKTKQCVNGRRYFSETGCQVMTLYSLNSRKSITPTGSRRNRSRWYTILGFIEKIWMPVARWLCATTVKSGNISKPITLTGRCFAVKIRCAATAFRKKRLCSATMKKCCDFVPPKCKHDPLHYNSTLPRH